MESLAEAGSSVLLDINNGERFVFARLNPSATVKLGKIKYSLQPVVGSPLGSVFETRRGPNGHSLERCAPDDFSEEIGEAEEEEISNKDNRNLIDNNTAQSLSAEEIHNMKREGTSGQEIVNALIANSTSFETKTVFSQEKYKLKKQKKYAPRLIVRRPTARSVCEAYFSKNPQKTGFLRVDALSLILSLANVGEKSNVLVLDTLGGLLTGAVAERLCGFGTVCSAYYTVKPPTVDIVGLFNFNTETTSRIFRAPLSKLLEALSPSGQASTTELPASEPSASETKRSEQIEPDGTTCESTLDMEVETTGEEAAGEVPAIESREAASGTSSEKPALKVSRAIRQASDEEVSGSVKEGFSSLIVAALDVDVSRLLQQLLPLVSPSSPFVVYHTHMQPLAECMHILQRERQAVSLQLSEPWLREYQVLPSRTHPQMQMSATGGYLLSGVRVATL